MGGRHAAARHPHSAGWVRQWTACSAVIATMDTVGLNDPGAIDASQLGLVLSDFSWALGSGALSMTGWAGKARAGITVHGIPLLINALLHAAPLPVCGK